MSAWDRLFEQSAEIWTTSFKNWGLGRHLKYERNLPSAAGSVDGIAAEPVVDPVHSQLTSRQSVVVAGMGDAQSAPESVGADTSLAVSDAAPKEEALEDSGTTAEHTQLPQVPAGKEPISKKVQGIVAHGLQNEVGSNHCFLNVAIQAFWNLWSFRIRFLHAPEHVHDDPESEPDTPEPEPTSATSPVEPADAAANAAASSAPDPALHPGAAPAASTGSTSGNETGEGKDEDAAQQECHTCKTCGSAESDAEEAPVKGAESCCFCALKSVFTQYQYSEETTLPPDALRKALSRAYTSVGRFQLGEMEDATETIETLLDILHASHMYSPKDSNDADAPAVVETPKEEEELLPPEDPLLMTRRRSSEVPAADKVEEASNTACQPPCLAHEVFGIEYVDLPRCTFCDATGEPTVVSSFSYRIYVAELLAVQGGRGAEAPEPLLSTVTDSVSRITARLAGSRAELQDLFWSLAQRNVEQKCAECNSRNTVVSERWLTRAPCIFMVSLVWPSSTPSRDSLWILLSAIQPQLHMEQIFRTEKSSRRPRPPMTRIQDRMEDALPFELTGDEADLLHAAYTPGPAAKAPALPPSPRYVFRGLICYYGMHYIAFFWCWNRQKWVLFDDTKVREEKDWSSVVSIIIGGQYVPTVLFYELSEGPISTEGMEELIRQVQDLEDRQNACSAM
mmetsp:Transcript_159906/g.298249  ORF Transcript_159906/g.298249 Transcript_159906/m.298249 type:complete len:679 (+) Transcript_159906:162-2198(+)